MRLVRARDAQQSVKRLRFLGGKVNPTVEYIDDAQTENDDEDCGCERSKENSCYTSPDGYLLCITHHSRRNAQRDYSPQHKTSVDPIIMARPELSSVI